ncbi:MAG: HAD family hydrolase [Promethearchaeota archaeon]|nr:MAG: HAD family hydrolase [Candidatus Lokiarchaeota archaeon]
MFPKLHKMCDMKSKNMVKGKEIIVFDLDGTIVKLKANWHSLKDLLSKRYSEINSESCSFSSISNCLSKIVEKGDTKELKENFKIIRQYELENITETEIIPEIVNFIKNKEKFGISKEVRMVVFSLNTRQTINESLKIAGISKNIDKIIGREDVRNWKPEPDGLIKIMQYYSVSPDKVVFFGDMEKDLKAGEAAKVDSYYVNDLIQFLEKYDK